MSRNPPTQPVAKRTDEIFEDLQRGILCGEHAPGDRLPPERELAVHYDTNRNTLREAIRMLEQVGLVTARQGRGVTVTDYHRTGTMALLGPYLAYGDDVRERVRVLTDLLEARAAVLRLTVTRVAQRSAAEDVARLREIAEAQRRAFEAEDRVALARGDLRWLDALVDAAHSMAVRWIANSFLQVYAGVLERFPSLWIVEPGYADYLDQLVDAVADGDPARAGDVIGDFFDRTDRTLVRLLDGLVDTAPIDPTKREEA